MLAKERRRRLLELVRLRRFAALPELVSQMEVSESTIRRDLELFEEEGVAKRTHGGVFYTGSSPKFAHFDRASSSKWVEKRAIARETAALIDDGDTVLFDGGSTTYEVARLLVGRPLSVVTTSLPVASLFASDHRSDLVLIGGNICSRTGVAMGPYADKMLATVRVRKTVLSVAGIKEEGFFNNNLLLVETEQAMMRAADEVIVVADASKFGRQSLAHLCPLQAVDRLVADDRIPAGWPARLEAAGVALSVAVPKEPCGEEPQTSVGDEI